MLRSPADTTTLPPPSRHLRPRGGEGAQRVTAPELGALAVWEMREPIARARAATLSP